MKRCTLALVALVVLGSVCTAHGAVTFYVSNPTGNSTAWTSAVSGLGGVVNTNVNFDAHPTGPLNNTFYSASEGVTLATTGSFSTVTFGGGPGQSNTYTPPLTPGEGPHAASNYLFAAASPSTLTISFNQPVLGVGLFVIDLFNPTQSGGPSNPVSIEAFTGTGGTGTSLGSGAAPAYNFQPNHLLYLGVVSTAGDIGSLRLTQPGALADQIGVDDVRFTRVIPEATSLVTWSLLALMGLAVTWWRRRRVG